MYSSRTFITSFVLLNIFLHLQLSADPRTLDFQQSYEELLETNYTIQSANANVWSKSGDVQQAGARPNPALAVNLNSIGRNGSDDNNEIFLGVTQLVELGGKRSARVRVADADQTVSMWAFEIEKKELFASLLNAFIDVAIAQERADLATAQQKVAEQMRAGVIEKTAWGKTSGVEQKKAEITFRTAKLTFTKQQANLQKAKRQLASFWSASPPSFDLVNFPLYQLLPPPPIESLLYEALRNSPELAKVQAQSAKACKLAALERALATPDVAVVVGVTTERFVEQPALTVGFGIPLPIFDRNQGNIKKANYGQIQAIYDEMDAQSQLKASIAVTYGEWIAAYEQAITLRNEVLPAAEESFEFAQASYKEGKYDYLHLLDARSTLIDVKEQYLDAIEVYHHKRAEALRLTSVCSLNLF